MIITCPSCSARYPVDAGAFAPAGRKVRCAKCGESWHQPPPDDLPKTIDLDEPADETADHETTPDVENTADVVAEERAFGADVVEFAQVAPVRAEADVSQSEAVAAVSGGGKKGLLKRGLAQAVGWLALLAFVGGSAYATYAYRDDIVRLWPATARLYVALNRPVNLRGMEFQNVAYEHQFENGLPVLAIYGVIVNVTNREMPVPRVWVGLRDDKQQELYHWTFAIPETLLAPAQSAEFVTRLSSPPLEARDLEVRFVDHGEEITGQAALSDQS